MLCCAVVSLHITCHGQSVLVRWLMFLLSVWETLGLKLGLETSCPVFMVFLKPLCVNVRIVSSNRPKPFPSTFFPVHHSCMTSSFDVIWTVLLKRRRETNKQTNRQTNRQTNKQANKWSHVKPPSSGAKKSNDEIY